METKSRNIVIFFVIVIFIIIVVATFIKVYTNHMDAMCKVVEKKITESAKECILKEECSDKITLGDLIEKGYLQNEVNPKTKEYLDTNLQISCKDLNCSFSIKKDL